MDVKIKENERIDDLEYKGLKIIQQNDGFCFGIDSVILSDFAKNLKKGSKVIDLGTGTGILGILLCAKTKLNTVTGIEIQKDVAEMANRSIKLNDLQEKFNIINTNILEINKLENSKYDVVITNPPYKKLDAGKKNDNEKKLISRHEITASLSDFIMVSKRLLKDNGTLYMVHRAERLADIMYEMRKNKIEPKVIKFVYSNENEESKLVLIKAVKNGKSFLTVEKPLIIYKNNGEYTDDILKIYNKI